MVGCCLKMFSKGFSFWLRLWTFWTALLLLTEKQPGRISFLFCQRSDVHIIDYATFYLCLLTLLSVEEILLLRYMYWSANLRFSNTEQLIISLLFKWFFSLLKLTSTQLNVWLVRYSCVFGSVQHGMSGMAVIWNIGTWQRLVCIRCPPWRCFFVKVMALQRQRW